jgi:signal transduction histidine kinase
VYEERRHLIQTGREKSLAYERLARVAEALRQSQTALQESEQRYRHLAEALREAYDELEQKVAERTAELTQTNAALQAEITERQRTQEQLKEETEIFAALAHVAQELIASFNDPTILERFCRLIIEVLECDRSSTVLWQPQEGAYVVAASYGNTPEQWEVIRTLKVPPEAVVDGMARLEKEGVVELEIASPPQSIPAVILHQFGVTAALFLTLRRGQEIIGAQTAAYCRQKKFSAKQKRIARGISQIASLALANAKLLEELEHANRVKEDFVGTMSHELRTPLNIILGYSDLLLEGEFGELRPEQLRVVQRVDKSARELVDLVTATLDLSRLQNQQLPLTLQEVQIAELVEEVVFDIRDLNLKPALCLQWETAPNLPLLHTDPLKLKLVLKNLLTNAVKFTDQGVVSTTAQNKGAGIEFCVTDTGIGIAPEALSVIFEPFRQLNNSTARLQSGVGLGLYIVRQLLDLLEGTISVDSEVGKGSIFRVWLPLIVERT